MSSSTWLANLEAALNALEKLDPADTTPAGFAAAQLATRQLEKLTAELRGFSPAERQAIQPGVAALQSRMAAAQQLLANTTHNKPRHLQSLANHGRALNAYLVSDAKK